jgi:alpha-mannosidase
MAYALYPHEGRWDEAQTVRRGYEFNVPLIPRVTDAHRGTLPPSGSFALIGPSQFVLTTVKRAEKDDGWILQWYDALGKGGEAVLTLPLPPRRAVLSDFLEGDGPPVAVSGRALRVPTPKHGVVTVKVTF